MMLFAFFDFAALERVLANYGVPLFILIVGGWALWSGAWRIAAWMKPRWEEWFEEEKETRKQISSTIAANSDALAKQSPVLVTINESVKMIDDRQLDKDSMVSNFHTIEKLNTLLSNDKRYAAAAISAMNALSQHHPDLHGKFEEAIHTLKEIA